MSNCGFIQIPRSLLSDRLWKDLPFTYRHVFLTILQHMAYKETIQDDFGVLVTVKPGQLLTTQRRLADLCEEDDIDRCLVQRSLLKLQNLGFSIQETIHKKTLITIARADILQLIDPNFDPNSIQTRSKLDPQKNKDNKDNKVNKEQQPQPQSSEKVVVAVFSEKEEKQPSQEILADNGTDCQHNQDSNITRIISPDIQYFKCLDKIQDESITDIERVKVSQKYDELTVTNAVDAITCKGFVPKTSMLKSLYAACKDKWKPAGQRKNTISDENINREYAKLIENAQHGEPGIKYTYLNSGFEIAYSAYKINLIPYNQPFEYFKAEIEEKSQKSFDNIKSIESFLKQRAAI